MFKIKDLLLEATKKLRKNNISQPGLESQIIMTNVLNCDRLHVLLNLDKEISKKQKKQFEEYINLRAQNYPLAYIIGKKEFMGFEFIISHDVFIPRQETEFLVEETIKTYSSLPKRKIKRLQIVDIGTGCGNIAISLAKFIPFANITGIDISKRSIEIAILNSKKHNVYNKIKFIQKDFIKFNKAFKSEDKFDFIISNPPYVSENEFKFLQREIFYEPKISLYGGKDGLSFYRQIADFSRKHLQKNGLTIVELSYNNSKKVIDIFSQKGLNFVKTVKDYSGFERVAVFTKTNG
ncbi:MAG: peptide chain release factor N(5)-glutamine methyltransferase [Endomicrobiia bacterium]